MWKISPVRMNGCKICHLHLFYEHRYRRNWSSELRQLLILTNCVTDTDPQPDVVPSCSLSWRRCRPSIPCTSIPSPPIWRCLNSPWRNPCPTVSYRSVFVTSWTRSHITCITTAVRVYLRNTSWCSPSKSPLNLSRTELRLRRLNWTSSSR